MEYNVHNTNTEKDTLAQSLFEIDGLSHQVSDSNFSISHKAIELLSSSGAGSGRTGGDWIVNHNETFVQEISLSDASNIKGGFQVNEIREKEAELFSVPAGTSGGGIWINNHNETFVLL